MRTITAIVETSQQATRLALGYDCPAVTAFIEDFEVAGSCRFIGIDADGQEVSILLISSARPAAFTNDTSEGHHCT